MKKKHRQNTSTPLFNLAQHERKPYFLPALGLCGLLMGILLFDANLSLTGDNAQFINLGRSLADGHGLSETIEGPNRSRTPNTPSDFRSSSPLPTSSSPDNLIALKSLVVLLYAISIPLTYLLIRRFAAPLIALGASALCLASSLLLDYSHQVMSEIPFLLFSLLALLFLHRAQKSNTLSTLALAIIAIIATYYIRSAGIILIATGILFFALHKKWKEAGLIAIGSFLLALPWQIRNTSLGGTPYIEPTTQHKPLSPRRRRMLTFTALTERILENLELYGMLKSSPIYLATQLLSTPTTFGVGLVFSGLVLYALIIRTCETAICWHRVSHLLSWASTSSGLTYGPTRAFSSRPYPSSSTPSSPAWTNCSNFSPEHLKKRPVARAPYSSFSFSSAQISLQPTNLAEKHWAAMPPNLGQLLCRRRMDQRQHRIRCQNRLPQALSHERDCQPQSHGLRLESTRPGHCRL